jgi:hypothetical protein
MSMLFALIENEEKNKFISKKYVHMLMMKEDSLLGL